VFPWFRLSRYTVDSSFKLRRPIGGKGRHNQAKLCLISQPEEFKAKRLTSKKLKVDPTAATSTNSTWTKTAKAIGKEEEACLFRLAQRFLLQLPRQPPT
jgi:hypothetical protein